MPIPPKDEIKPPKVNSEQGIENENEKGSKNTDDKSK